jgi:hypothetical protein
MKKSMTLPGKKTGTVGKFSAKADPQGTSPSTTDTTSVLSLSTTHLFNR